MGVDVGEGDGGAEDWDQGARCEGLGAIDAQSFVQGGSGAKGGPVVLLGVVRVGDGREDVGEESVDLYG